MNVVLKAGVAEPGKGARFRVSIFDGGFSPERLETASGKISEAIIDYDRYRDEFVHWMREEKKLKNWKEYAGKLDKLLKGKKINSPQKLYEIFKDEPKTSKVAIKDFMKFLIETGKRTKSQLIDFQAVIKIPKSGIRPASEAFTTTEKIIEALKEVKDEKKRLMIKLLAYSGLRLSEAVELLKNFNPKELTILPDLGIARYDLLAMYKRVGRSPNLYPQFPHSYLAISESSKSSSKSGS
ncbi:integrase [Archaeoglobus veneficus]|uniref:integrase n=1 Tax=Archaeoglobus veneficus TaxID=58290 RepID=UPI00064FFEEA|nr:integrase [Archaeoglobus veneficus]